MNFEAWQSGIRLAFLEPTVWEYLLLSLYGLLTLVVLIRSRDDFTRLTWPRLLLFIGLLVAPLLTERLLVVTFLGSDLLPPPNIPFAPSQPFVPLLGMLPVIAAGAWLGAGPALLVGLVCGVLRTGATTGGINDPFHIAFLGAIAGFLLRQDFRGKLPRIARQPLVAAFLATISAMFLLLVSAFVHVAHVGLSGLDYAITLTRVYFAPALLESIAAALIVQLIYLFFSHLVPVQVARRSPPYKRSLNSRFLYLFVPLIIIITVTLLYVVTNTALQLATSEAVDEMARDALGAAEGVPYFIHTGQGLLTEFASDETLWLDDPIPLEQALGRDLRTVAFFDQLILFGPDGQQLAMYPPSPTGSPELTNQEIRLLNRVLESGATQISNAHASNQGQAILSFITPLEPQEAGASTEVRALVGRTRLDVNPMINRILAGLQRTDARGEGFIVDSEGHIIAHPDHSMILTDWHVDKDRPRIATVLRGWAYESRNRRDNTRQIVYYWPVEGHPWGVVIRLPYEVVLEQAEKTATPLLLLQVLLGGGLIIVLSLVTGWLTQPLQQLAVAADRIAEGDLTQPVEISGEDEVARVGDAFNDMRVRLKNRMSDLSLLLEVSQAVSATLELPQGMPFVLEGALKATQAQVARIILLSADGEPQVVMSRGQPREGLGPLDRSLALAAKDMDHPLTVSNVPRARTLGDAETLKGPIKAALALPIRTKNRTSAVMWVGYGEVRQFDDSEIDLLSTLASQTAVLVENARLFQTAEGGRRRLAAILASTTDAVLVTDRDNCILLINPAAEQAFGVEAELVSEQEISEIGLAPALVQVFEEPLSPHEALTKEVPLPDGRTLYANVSTIVSADNKRIGRVAVMRDITHLKELDEMKSDFIATVSHDLRAPLTFMRGYATMLPTVGTLNDKQREYTEKILRGVGQMSELVNNLLDLGRIEAGVGLDRKPCHLGAILVEAVDSMRGRAKRKDLTLRMEPAQGMAIVSGDATLLRQAFTNLVDNAIKYTPNGGSVTVGLSVSEENGTPRAIVHVTDTGIGIAPEDQMRLFEKFYRIQRRDAPAAPGTGLGLSLVKSIIERHDGEIWVESKLNEGSTFYAALPLKED
jgi:PAS domain S-box-containing protein